MEIFDAYKTGLLLGVVITLVVVVGYWLLNVRQDAKRLLAENFRSAEPFLRKQYRNVAYRAFSEFDRRGWGRNCETWVGFVTFFKDLGYTQNQHIVTLLDEIHDELSVKFHGGVRFAGWEVASNQYLTYPDWGYALFNKKGQLIVNGSLGRVHFHYKVDRGSAQQSSWQQTTLLSHHADTMQIYYPDGRLFKTVPLAESLQPKY